MTPPTTPNDPDDHDQNTDPDDHDQDTLDDYTTTDDTDLHWTTLPMPNHDYRGGTPTNDDSTRRGDDYTTRHLPRPGADQHGAYIAWRNTVAEDLPDSPSDINDDHVATRRRRDHHDENTTAPAYIPPRGLSTDSAPRILTHAAQNTDGCDPRDAIALAYTAARTRPEWNPGDATGPLAAAETRRDDKCVLAYHVTRDAWQRFLDDAGIDADDVRAVATAHQRCAQSVADADAHVDDEESVYGATRDEPVVCLPAPF